MTMPPRDTDVPTELRDLWDSVPAGPAPLADIVRAGERKRTRRRVAVGASVAAVAVVLSAGAVALPRLRGQRSDAAAVVADKPSAAASASTSPAVPGVQTRLLGFAGLTLQVPASWPVLHTACTTPRVAHITFVGTGQYNCMRSPTGPPPAVTALAIAPAGTEGAPTSGWVAAVSRNGVVYQHTATSCSGQLCTRAYRVPGGVMGSGVVVTLTTVDKQLLRTLPATFARLPAGQSAVPFFDPGTPLAEATQMLHHADLTADPDLTVGDHLIAMSEQPAAGTVLPAGTPVSVHVEAYTAHASTTAPSPH